ncbi:hypothetical protein G3545_08530 [Starkeya sp. ORNL1]|uniref:hypothetical protein n=1 Tax=Starkeya sp. ORNL1 TaxID=2709380 RepID=UPI0014639804|nr:hypothetical protein [Starkeya sp. ORNL1]QJP13698.1 hypothetical protein G3545_08530 [Starkeya sp. ORNL1]
MPQLIAQGGRAIRDYAEPLIGGLTNPLARPEIVPAGGAPPVRPPNAYENRMPPPERPPAARAVPEAPPGWSNAEIFAPPDPAAGRFRTDYSKRDPSQHAFEHGALNQEGGKNYSAPRTPGLGTHVSMDELMRTGALPGQKGVIIVGRPVTFGEVYKLSTLNGRKVEFLIVRHRLDGKPITKLYSGNHEACPLPEDGWIVAHTHPTEGSTQRMPSDVDMRILNRRYFRDLEANPKLRPPRSWIIWGGGSK